LPGLAETPPSQYNPPRWTGLRTPWQKEYERASRVDGDRSLTVAALFQALADPKLARVAG
jgi:hypothetical protein